MRRLIPAISLFLLAVAALAIAGCGQSKPRTKLLESERKLQGMYEACKNIKLTETGAEPKTINTEEIKKLHAVEIGAVLKRANGLKLPGKWSGVPLSDVLEYYGVAPGFKELRIEGWDGYVGRFSQDIANRPDTILASVENGKPLPRDDGPVRLVVASQDGFYWIRMITSVEVIR
jgi:hypothetical protein